MEFIEELVQKDNFLSTMFILNVVVIILLLINIIITVYDRNKYIRFMKKIGNGNSLDEQLRKYLKDVAEIKKDNREIKAYYTQLDANIDACVQKIGLVRYNAFKDVGSDLSFAIALLDRNNNGVVLNGLYGAESSNIYAKPIKNGESKYILSQEERDAIEIAEQSKRFITKGNIYRNR